MSTVMAHMERVRAIAAHGRVWAFGGARTAAQSAITLYDGPANKPLARIELNAHVLALCVTSESVVAGCSDGTVRVFALTGAPVMTLAAHHGECTALAINPRGDHVLSAGADGFVRRWALASDVGAGEWALSSAALRAVAIDPQGESFAAAGDDGVVRVVALASGARREMNGHLGAVNALAFTPRDGRLASAGDDGIVRIWYLVGAVEFEARGADDSGHKGPVLALAFGPTGVEDGKETAEKLFSAGEDGAVKVWRLEDRKRTRALTLSSTPARALAFTPPGKNTPGALLVGFDDRGLYRVNLCPNGAPEEGGAKYDSLLDQLSSERWGTRPSRDATVRALAAMDEPEALAMLCEIIQSDDTTAVSALAVSEAARCGRRGARAVIVEALNSDEEPLWRAAFDALRVLDGEDSLAPMYNALAAQEAALRLLALEALAGLAGRVPLAAGVIASRLDDPDASVRLGALTQWLKVSPRAADALRVAFERSPEDVRREVLVHAAHRGLLRDPALASTVMRALDDPDAEVRKTAFTALVLERRALVRALEPRDPALALALQDLLRRVAQIAHGDPTHTPSEKEIKRAREVIPCSDTGGAPSEADLAPLLTAIACRSSDTGLWGATALGAIEDSRALGALLQLSREPEAWVRSQTATALAGIRDPRASGRVAAMLGDPDANVRAVARDAYAKVEGVRALGLAEASLRSPQEDIRVRGLDEVAKLGKGAAAEALLEDAIEDESVRVRSEAFRTLWSWHDKTPEPALARAMSARFPDVRQRAVTELSALGAKPWARARLLQAISDADESVAFMAFNALVKGKGEADPEGPLAGMVSAHATLRARAAAAAAKCPAEAVRAALVRLFDDRAPEVRTTAVETLDKLFPQENTSLHAALAAAHPDLRVRAAELLAERHDEQIIEPMRALMTDPEIARTTPAAEHAPRVLRAARALATLGSRKLLEFFSDTLLKHADDAVREQGGRGLAMASRKGDESALVDALGSTHAGARSWAADGLARLGDPRALPVLTGNLKNQNSNIRFGAILSFAALGPEGFGGLLTGLDDPSVDAQIAVFLIVLARDLRARRRGEAPEMLISALSSQPAEVRFGAARALELRSDPEKYMAYLISALTPPTSVRGASPKGFPPEAERGRILVGLAEALAGDHSEQRYAAAQVLLLRRQPERFFREAERVGAAASETAWIADTDVRPPAGADDAPARDWLKKLFARGARLEDPGALTEADKALRELAFGAYVGLVRQTSTHEDGHRVRRSAIDRLVELGLSADIGAASVVAALTRALDDPHHLVRKAAFSGLRRVFGEDVDAPLDLALASTQADVARAALDELGARGAAVIPRVARALNHGLAEVRWHAFQWVEKLSAPGSQEPFLMALASDYGDLRIGVIERLSASRDPRVSDALVQAMSSEREDLRLRAAELLARRRDDRAVEVLSGSLGSENPDYRARALAALAALGSRPAVLCLGRRMAERGDDRVAVAQALGGAREGSAIEVLSEQFNDEALWRVAFNAALTVMGPREKRNDAWALQALRAGAKAKEAPLRAAAAEELGYVRDHAASGLLTGLFVDRLPEVRKAAVGAYGRRVIEYGAPAGPLEQVLRDGVRELVLPAAEALASRGVTAALQTLLLVARAGEPEEQPRAILALGALGDGRSLGELELFAAGGTEEIPVLPANRDAAIEALGRTASKLTDPEARQRVIEKVEIASGAGPTSEAKCAGVRGLRWIGGERSRLLLEDLATSAAGDYAARGEACKALGELADPRAEGALARALQDPDSGIYHEPYEALRKVFSSERTRVELHALKCVDDDVASRAARFLAVEGTPGALVSRMADIGSAELRKKLLYGLLRRGAAPVNELAELLSHADAGVRSDAAWLIGARASVPETEAAIGWSADDRARLAGALALAESSQRARWGARPEGDRGAETSAWTHAVWALGAVGGGAYDGRFEELCRASALDVPEAVRVEARRAREARQPREFIAKSLMDMVATRDTAGLIERAKATADEGARREAIDALGRVGGDGAAALLVALAFDKKSVEIGLRKAAFRALRRVQRATKKTRQAQKAEA